MYVCLCSFDVRIFIFFFARKFFINKNYVIVSLCVGYPPLTEMLIDNIKPHGFDFPCKEFSIPEDKDIIVRRNSILARWGAIELFNERFMYLYTIGNALDLAQVNLYVINISVCQYILTYVLIKLL